MFKTINDAGAFPVGCTGNYVFCEVCNSSNPISVNDFDQFIPSLANLTIYYLRCFTRKIIRRIVSFSDARKHCHRKVVGERISLKWSSCSFVNLCNQVGLW